MKKTTRGIIAMLLVLTMMLTLAACGSSGSESSQPVGGDTTQNPGGENPGGENPGGNTGLSDETLIVGVGSEPTSLDVADCGTYGGVVDNALYDNLIFYNSQTGEYEPMLATSWEFLDDTTTRFHLRDDVVAPDGTILDANDVLYTFKRGMEVPGAVQYFGIYDLDNCDIVDQFTIDLKTFSPDASAFANLAFTSLAIMDESSTEAAGGIDTVITAPANGTGPYKFVEWKPGEYITIERNDNYWGEKGYYKQIQIRFITDETTRTLSLIGGDVDVITGVSSAQADTIAVDSNYQLVEQTSKNAVVLCVNTKSSNTALADVRVRQAIAYAINKEAIVTVGFEGYGTILDTPVSKANPLCPNLGSEYLYDYNVEKAKELLADAGYADGLTIELLYYAGNELTAEVLQNQLREVGITLVLNISDVWADINASGNFDILLCTFFGRNNTQIFGLMDNRINYNDRNHCAYGEDSYHADLDALYQALDPSTVTANAQRLMEQFMKDIPAIGLCSSNYLFAARKDLTGFYAVTGLDQLLVHKIRPAA